MTREESDIEIDYLCQLAKPVPGECTADAMAYGMYVVGGTNRNNRANKWH